MGKESLEKSQIQEDIASNNPLEEIHNEPLLPHILKTLQGLYNRDITLLESENKTAHDSLEKYIRALIENYSRSTHVVLPEGMRTILTDQVFEIIPKIKTHPDTPWEVTAKRYIELGSDT